MAKKPKRPARRVAKRAAKKSAKRPSAKKKATRKSSSAAPRRHEATRGLYGWITHTELASDNPGATKAWAQKVLGWTFMPSVPMPGGEYHLFAYSDKGGGGIRRTNPSEQPGSNFTVHVADAQAAYDQALREGAEPIHPPERIMEGVTIAAVRAPGGVRVGFSGP
ncbi:MAG: VOC family protein [Gemmatimonadales bacterium]